jgi:hypothetical protein
MNKKKEQTGLDLLSDIAKLIKKHGVEEFEELAIKLADERFVRNLSQTIKILSKSARDNFNNQPKKVRNSKTKIEQFEEKTELSEWRDVISKNREQATSENFKNTVEIKSDTLLHNDEQSKKPHKIMSPHFVNKEDAKDFEKTVEKDL